MILLEAKKLKAGDIIYCNSQINSRQEPVKAKVLSVKTWKTKPNTVILSCKTGRSSYFKLSEEHIQFWELSEELDKKVYEERVAKKHE